MKQLDSTINSVPETPDAAGQIVPQAKISRGPKPSENRKSVLIGVHCTPKMVAQLEVFISRLEYDEMSKPEAIRLILKRYFKDTGIE